VKKNKKNHQGEGGGRPSKYKSIDLEQVKKLASYGLIDEEIASVIGISRPTLWKYKKNKKFLNAIKEGNDFANSKVVQSLFHRAIGYNHKEDKIFCTDGQVTTVPTVKYYPPDSTACFFWLCNRLKNRWENVNKIEHSGKDGEAINLKFVPAKDFKPHADQ